MAFAWLEQQAILTNFSGISTLHDLFSRQVFFKGKTPSSSDLQPNHTESISCRQIIELSSVEPVQLLNG